MEPEASPTLLPTILVVDDTPDVLVLMQAFLRDNYRVLVASDGEHGLRIARQTPPPDLILLDVSMPGMGGYAVCEQLKQDPATRTIPVIFLTSHSDPQDEEKGFLLGAVDYLSKPVSAVVAQARLRTHLSIKIRDDYLRDKNVLLEDEVARRTREINVIQDVTIFAMAALAEARDVDTGNHVRRVQHYVRALAWKLSSHPRFRLYLSVPTISMLYKSTPLHDIGKAAIPDRILLKRGRLTPEEFEIMKTHTSQGRDAIAHAEATLGVEAPFFTMAKEIAYSHQEKWDGTGYPQGLKGEHIPISARLMAVADVYDALISRRTYKEPMQHAEAVQVIQAASGQHFDPDVVEAFMQIHQQFYAIALAYADSSSDLERKAEYLKISLENPP